MHSPGGFYESLYDETLDVSKLPTEEAILTTAPDVPPPIARSYPVLLKVALETKTKVAQLTNQYKYEQWTFNGSTNQSQPAKRVKLTINNGTRG